VAIVATGDGTRKLPRRQPVWPDWSQVRLLVLGAGPGQLGVLAAARARGLFVIAADRNPAAPGFRYAHRRAILSPDDEPALERLAEAERVDGAIAAGPVAAVGAAARIAARFGLPHPLSPEAAVLASSKLRQRQRLLAAGVPQTRWKLVSRPDEELGFPCVVEPPDRQARGRPLLVRSREELGPAVREAVHASRAGRCLIEEAAGGADVVVPAFSLTGAFHPLLGRDTAAAAVAARAAEALGIGEGPTSTRLRPGPEGPRVVQLRASVDDREAELCLTAAGIDVIALALDAALGEEIAPERLEPRARAAAAAKYVRLRTPDAEAFG
jgi:hypothetical protein